MDGITAVISELDGVIETIIKQVKIGESDLMLAAYDF